jgi:hypothetical protein
MTDLLPRQRQQRDQRHQAEAQDDGTGLLWLNRVSGAVILGFGLVALISLLPLPWKQIGHFLGL